MKNLLILIIFTFYTSLTFGSCDVKEFYAELSNTSGYEFKTSLSNLLAKTHKRLSYDELHKIYVKSDLDRWYEADGSIMDMYSENPKGADPYVYMPQRKTCGQVRGESSCYNREHLFPQGLFRKGRPMKTDIFHVYPTDGLVNRKRGSLPFGEVGKVRWASQNGSKVGHYKGRDYNGMVFEPLDEFKGDIARAMLYFAVRYENYIPRFKRHAMTDGSRNQTYSTWFLNVLLRWHKLDPVSEHEVLRNNVACKYQMNRNPFIDHPEWVGSIWEIVNLK